MGKGVMVTENYTLVKNEREFDRVLQSMPRLIALVYANWCPFCQSFLPVFKTYAYRKDHFVLVEDNQERLAEKYGVEIIPTVLFFENGHLSKRLDGVPGIGLFERQLTQFLQSCALVEI
jgi:thioredoxin-like negative regulator of GroEL